MQNIRSLIYSEYHYIVVIREFTTKNISNSNIMLRKLVVSAAAIALFADGAVGAAVQGGDEAVSGLTPPSRQLSRKAKSRLRRQFRNYRWVMTARGLWVRAFSGGREAGALEAAVLQKELQKEVQKEATMSEPPEPRSEQVKRANQLWAERTQNDPPASRAMRDNSAVRFSDVDDVSFP